MSSTENGDTSAQPSPTQMSRAAGPESSTPARPDNAFQRMMTQARAQRLGPAPEDTHATRLKQKGRSALVDEQAEESDEDAGWGPTERGADDEDDGNEDDGYVEGLVDDDKVDEATKRAQDRLAEEKMRYVFSFLCFQVLPSDAALRRACSDKAASAQQGI
jgi:mediator of replication checkpoint protein 1